MTFFDYLNNCSGFIVFLIVMAIVEVIPKCFKWIAIAIRGHQEVEQVYITAADTSDDDWDEFDDEDYQTRIKELTAANLNLQGQIDALQRKKNVKK